MDSMQRKNANAVSARVVLKLGDDISTDAIYPGRYMATVLPTETPRYAFADFAEFSARLQNKEITPGSIVIAGTNFGCGSSREQAASALKGHDIVVIARGFGRIFLQNAVNLGLNIMVCPRLDADEGDELEIAGNQVRNITANKNFDLQPIPAARRAIIDAGGLIPYTRERLLKLQTARSEVR
jgi:3-isopropylmalate/(R)-2-methylmalate dehydratase small subunit